MKTIIAGSRTIEDYAVLKDCIAMSEIKISEIVSGGARGVDALGEMYAKRNKIPVRLFRADWNKYGKSAGIRRNVLMALYAEALIALWDGKSKGTKHMIDFATRQGLLVKVFRL